MKNTTIWRVCIRIKDRKFNDYFLVIQPASFSFCELAAVDSAVKEVYGDVEYDIRGINTRGRGHLLPGFEYFEIEPVLTNREFPPTDFIGDRPKEVIRELADGVLHGDRQAIIDFVDMLVDSFGNPTEV